MQWYLEMKIEVPDGTTDVDAVIKVRSALGVVGIGLPMIQIEDVLEQEQREDRETEAYIRGVAEGRASEG